MRAGESARRDDGGSGSAVNLSPAGLVGPRLPQDSYCTRLQVSGGWMERSQRPTRAVRGSIATQQELADAGVLR